MYTFKMIKSCYGFCSRIHKFDIIMVMINRLIENLVIIRYIGNLVIIRYIGNYQIHEKNVFVCSRRTQQTQKMIRLSYRQIRFKCETFYGYQFYILTLDGTLQLFRRLTSNTNTFLTQVFFFRIFYDGRGIKRNEDLCHDRHGNY